MLFRSFLVALVKFTIEPRIRVWDKDLAQEELVRHVEKPVEIIPTKSLNRGSLKQLALIMDTHGTQKDPTIQLQDETNTALGYGQRIITPQQVATATQNGAGAAASYVPMPREDVLDVQGGRGTEVNQMLENVESKIHSQALNQIKQGLVRPQKTAPAPQRPLAPQTSNAIIKKAVYQGNNLTVAQIAKETNANLMTEGQTIKLNQASQ